MAMNDAQVQQLLHGVVGAMPGLLQQVPRGSVKVGTLDSTRPADWIAFRRKYMGAVAANGYTRNMNKAILVAAMVGDAATITTNIPGLADPLVTTEAFMLLFHRRFVNEAAIARFRIEFETMRATASQTCAQWHVLLKDAYVNAYPNRENDYNNDAFLIHKYLSTLYDDDVSELTLNRVTNTYADALVHADAAEATTLRKVQAAARRKTEGISSLRDGLSDEHCKLIAAAFKRGGRTSTKGGSHSSHRRGGSSSRGGRIGSSTSATHTPSATHTLVDCYACGKKGHIARECRGGGRQTGGGRGGHRTGGREGRGGYKGKKGVNSVEANMAEESDEDSGN